jgi:hypothetical protein
VDLQCSGKETQPKVTNTYLNPMLFIAGIHYVVPPFRAWRAVKLAGGLSQ